MWPEPCYNRPEARKSTNGYGRCSRATRSSSAMRRAQFAEGRGRPIDATKHGETRVEELGKPNSNKLLISSDWTRVSWGSGTVHPTHPQTETPASMWMDAMC